MNQFHLLSIENPNVVGDFVSCDAVADAILPRNIHLPNTWKIPATFWVNFQLLRSS